MSSDFDYFVVFAEMRTGSNFLEQNINNFGDLICHGEVFNPHFVAYPSTETLFEMDQKARDGDPLELLDRLKTQSDGMGGFRFFYDHDHRAFDAVIADKRCAKVILTRNPVDSFVSWKIAEATGQWKLTNATHHKAIEVNFDPDEFEQHLTNLQEFQVKILNGLQRSGQTAFFVAYEDLQDVDVMNGLGQYLGSASQLDGLSKKLKKQNPSPMQDKVANFDQMEASLAKLDRFNLNRTLNFEPRRGPVVPSYVAAANAPILYLPIRGGPNDQVLNWLAGIDGSDRADLIQDFSQKSIRQWKRQNKGHRTFTAIRHPVRRAYDAFCRHIFHTHAGSYIELRKTLIRVHNLDLPDTTPGTDFSADQTRAAFIKFLKFVRANLNGQTAVRVDAAWASQSLTIQGFAEFSPPDLIVREETLAEELGFLAGQVGCANPSLQYDGDDYRFPLSEIYDDEIESIARDAYQRDYLNFGYFPLKRY